MKILRVLNFLPFFHLSCDENFGEYVLGDKWRVSLLVILFGRSKLYFYTYSKEKKFSFFYRISFSASCPGPTQKEIDKKAAEYATHIREQEATSLEIQLDLLKESYASNLTSEASMENRVSSYVAAYLVLLGFYVYLFDQIYTVSDALPFWLNTSIFLVGTLFLTSSGAFIWLFLGVRVIVRPKFNDLKNNPTLHKRVELAYTAWYASKEEVRYLISQLKNIEHNLAYALGIAIFSWLILFYNTKMN